MSNKIALIMGSVRDSRINPKLTNWILESVMTNEQRAQVEIIDLLEWNLPFFDEPKSPKAALGKYEHEHSRKWADKIKQYDGYIFVSPQYNFSVPAVLKNAIDYLYIEWTKKPATIFTYGFGGGGLKSQEHLTIILGESISMVLTQTKTPIVINGSVNQSTNEQLQELFQPSLETGKKSIHELFDLLSKNNKVSA
ncbi:NADPH-dependent FMN reductase family protein [Tieghemostelium lacteum]|uniref:NADPH-dependent FMN reductase family protein n=1 Tax=Tieghemostelium lacteum TaxID=361077 RepID=A0A151ZHM5_TIELA|nr:NADPH-dependent FMN reductase family protein [Tieghemostelium lacteum]|eukprot:KYQ93364.1 NADPH-dependent FMN reductase family protein [Tieghemostelium lacteum]